MRPTQHLMLNPLNIQAFLIAAGSNFWTRAWPRNGADQCRRGQ
jgi:hypothetical protein